MAWKVYTRLSHLQRVYTGSVTLIIIVGQPSTPRSRNYHCSHFPDGNTEAQRRKMSHTGAHTEEAVELGFKLKTLKSCLLCWRCSRNPCCPALLMPHPPWHSQTSVRCSENICHWPLPLARHVEAPLSCVKPVTGMRRTVPKKQVFLGI